MKPGTFASVRFRSLKCVHQKSLFFPFEVPEIGLVLILPIKPQVSTQSESDVEARNGIIYFIGSAGHVIDWKLMEPIVLSIQKLRTRLLIHYGINCVIKFQG